MWEQIDSGVNEDSEYAGVLTRTFQMIVSEGFIVRTETVWPGGGVTESMVFVPRERINGE